ncbi:MAG: lipocalin family protein [Pseudomonadota bacterium]
MTTTGQVDLTRYQGRWFEIARFPNSFEEGCVGVTADYSLNEDGTVRVLNTCIEGSLDGEVSTAEGIATTTTPDKDRLEVTFVPWLPFAKGDYWILDLTPDYSVAVVGTPSGSVGWILARAPRLDAPTLEAAKAVLAANGYDLSQLTLTPQEGGA